MQPFSNILLQNSLLLEVQKTKNKTKNGTNETNFSNILFANKTPFLIDFTEWNEQTFE